MTTKTPPKRRPGIDPKEEELDKLLRAIERHQRAQDRKKHGHTKPAPARRK